MDSEKIGKFIKMKRIEYGYTQTILAEKIFITREAVSKWERGVRIPDVTSLIILSQIFNVTINEILLPDENNI